MSDAAKLLEAVRDYEEAHTRAEIAQNTISAWILDFVGIKEGDILEQGKTHNHIYITGIHTHGRFSGWRDNPRRMRVGAVFLRNSAHSTFPHMTVSIHGVPLKADGSPFNGAGATVAIDLADRAADYAEGIGIESKRRGFYNDALAAYIGFINQKRSATA